MSLLLLVIGLLIYPLAGYAILWGYHGWRRSGSVHSWMALALLAFYGLVMTYLTIDYFGGAFGPGVLMLCIAPPFGILGLLIHFRLSRRYRSEENVLAPIWWRSLLLAVFVVTVFMAPLPGYYAVTSLCNGLHARAAEPLVQALDDYREAQGNYPGTVEALVPEYIEAIPTPFCFGLFPQAQYQSYTLERCPEPILWLDVVQRGFPQRLNLETGEWSTISFLDGVCSFLE